MKKFLMLLCFMMMIFNLTGCGDMETDNLKVQKETNVSKQDFTPVTEIKDGRKDVYAVLKVIKGNYWQELIRGLKESGDAADVNVYVGGVLKDGDWELQREMINDLSDKKVDAVILGAADSMNMTQTAKELRQKNLPVVLVDTGLNSQDYDAAYLTDNLAAGADVAKKMVEMLHENGIKDDEKILVAMHISTLASRTVSERLDSIIANWHNVAPKAWKIDTDYIINYGDESGAVKLVEDAMKNNSALKGVFSCNNSSTNATVEAVIKAGRKDIAIMGFDLGKKTISGLQNKNYNIATAVQNEYKMGFEALKAAVGAIDGKLPAQKDVNTGITIVDKNTYSK